MCLLPHTHPLACGGLPPPWKLLRWMAFSRCCRRRQPQKKGRWGNLCLLSHTYPLACGGDTPPLATFAVDGFQPLPPIGDSRKKKGGGEICACCHTPTPLLAEEIPHPWHFDPLTVISLSTRKSPTAASGPRPSEAIPPVAKQGGDAKRGEGEARKAGEADSLTP